MRLSATGSPVVDAIGGRFESRLSQKDLALIVRTDRQFRALSPRHTDSDNTLV
jgi:hypothetical protein